MADWPKAILLDLDDTILAFDSVSDASWHTVLEEYAGQFGDTGIGRVFAAIKSSSRRYWQDPQRHRAGRLDLTAARQVVVFEALQKIGIVDDELVRRIAVAYDRVRTEAIHPIPGAIETLQEMRLDGVSLALITNGAAKPQREKIDRFELGRFFDCILIEGECGYGKPDKRVYVRALSALDVSAGDVWMAGDNWEWDVAAPQRLGVRGIWVNSDDKPLPENCGIEPFQIIRSLPELGQRDFSDAI